MLAKSLFGQPNQWAWLRIPAMLNTLKCLWTLETPWPLWLLTQELVGRWGGEVELLLQVLSQEGGEAGHHRDLHAGRQDDTGEDGIGEQVLSYFGDHWKRGKRERCFCVGSAGGAGGALLLSSRTNSLQMRSNSLLCTDKLVEMWQHQNKVKHQNSVI